MHCDVDLLRVIAFTQDFVDLSYIMIPIILIILTSFDLGKIVIGKEADFSSGIKKITKRMIFGVVIFFIPVFITLALELISHKESEDTLACWEYATDDIIKEKMKEKEAKQKIEQEKRDKEWEEEQAKKIQDRKDELAKRQKEKEEAEKAEKEKQEAEKGQNGQGSTGSITETSGPTNTDSTVNIPKSNYLTPFVNGKQKALKKGDCMRQSDNCACPAQGRFSGFYFTMKNSTGRDMNWTKRNADELPESVSVTCADGVTLKAKVNPKVKQNFVGAFNKICQLTTTGVLDWENIKYGGSLYARTNTNRTICSFHAYGSAIDYNYSLKIKVNGKTYMPYSGQGKSTKAEYDRFVKALGKEKDPRNVNYYLWIYAFQPNGFTWGGNWSGGSFDPMHFEIK